MFQRNISVEEVQFILQNGRIVNEYPDDQPYPSKLLFAVCNARQLHVVCSENCVDNEVIIITAYEANDSAKQKEVADLKDYITKMKGREATFSEIEQALQATGKIK